MRWSGWLRLLMIALAVTLATVLRVGAQWTWWSIVLFGAVTYLGVPILLGLVWGLVERRQLERHRPVLLGR